MELKSVQTETQQVEQTPDTSRLFVIDEQNQGQKEAQQQKKLYRIFFLLGIGALLPFNCIIVPVDFWLMFYNPIFLSAAALSYNAGNWIVTLYMMIRGYKHNKNPLMLISLTTWLVSLIIIPVLHPIISNILVKTVITLVPITLCGMANGLYFPTVLDMGCKLGPLNAQAMMAGNGIAGLVTQFLLILIKGIVTGAKVSEDQYNKTLFYQTLAYFILGAGYIIVCFFVWAKLKPILNGHNQLSTQQQNNEEQIEEKSSFWQVFKMIIVPSLSIFFIFAITLAIFPTIIAPIPFNTNAKKNALGSDNGWWNIGVMTTFMIFDWVGRQMPVFKWASACLNLKACLCLAVSRLVFFAVFLLEALPKYVCDDHSCAKGPIIKSDIVTILTMIVFALSNGWLSSVTMMKYSSCVTKKVDGSLAANIQTFMLNSGLFAGGLLSLGIAVPFSK
ncbi:Nucleoside_transporter [Hexamita inflata]|uniref:Nucleoside transporter n=1 Tax=Hexamita inflata TaxID=28002 RepID=A0AA86QLR9_9EUKA|nr:Nucleoside transporter [Hexamita inflata]CAI9954080.1 Nucleoside transporter [Hexamita inflata]